MGIEYWKNLGLTDEEAVALENVNNGAVVSFGSHLNYREEIKPIDMLTADTANSAHFKNAWEKIHEAEKQVPVSELDN